MNTILNGFIRCLCGKIHTVSGIGIGSKCQCGRFLMEQVR